MSLVQIIVITLVIPVFVRWFIFSIKKEEIPKENIVCMPKVLCILGNCGAILAGILIIGSFFFSIHPLIWVVLICVAVLSLVLLLVYNSLCIVYNEQQFCIKKFFFKRIYYYTDIQSMIPSAGTGYTLKMKAGSVRVDGLAIGAQEFLSFANTMYSKSGKGSCIPDSHGGIFHGYILNPWPMIILFCIPGIALLGFAVASTADYYITAFPPTELEETTIKILNCEQSFKDIQFETENGVLWIPEKAVSNFQNLQIEIQEQQLFQVVHEQWSNSTEPRACVWQITSNESIYATFDVSLEVYQHRQIMNIFGFWLACLIYWIFGALCYYVLDHAPQYPRLTSLIVRKEYHNF